MSIARAPTYTESQNWTEFCRAMGHQPLPPHRCPPTRAAILHATREREHRAAVAREAAERAAMWGLE